MSCMHIFDIECISLMSNFWLTYNLSTVNNDDTPRCFVQVMLHFLFGSTKKENTRTNGLNFNAKYDELTTSAVRDLEARIMNI